MSKHEDLKLIHLKLGSCISYILATKTRFFRKKFDENWSDLYTDENFVFMAQLFNQNIGIYHVNTGLVLEVNYILSFK